MVVNLVHLILRDAISCLGVEVNGCSIIIYAWESFDLTSFQTVMTKIHFYVLLLPSIIFVKWY